MSTFIDKPVKKTELEKHIERLLSVTLNIKSNYAVKTFFLLCIGLFLTTFIFLPVKNITTLLFSLTVGLFPYLLLYIKLYTIRIESSYEAENLVSELISQYKINHFNMIEAIDKTIPRLTESPYTRRALFRLSLQLKQYRTIEQLEDIIQEFTFSINTQWAILLANCMFLSIQYGDDVTKSLDDILDDIKELKAIFEKNKQLNNETFIMIKYVAPGSYFFTVFMALRYFNFTIDKFIAYQFKHPLGLRMFIIAAILMIANFIIYIIIRKPKYDF